MRKRLRESLTLLWKICTSICISPEVIDGSHGSHLFSEAAEVFGAVLAGAQAQHLTSVAHPLEHLPATLLTPHDD